VGRIRLNLGVPGTALVIVHYKMILGEKVKAVLE
jgi:hypothetical protein